MKSKLLLLTASTLTLALTACGAEEPPIPAEPVVVTTISGKVIDGSGVGTAGLWGGSLGSAKVAEDGSLEIALPQPDKFEKNLVSADKITSVPSCTGAITASDATAKGMLIGDMSVKRGGLESQVIAGDLTIDRVFGVPTSAEYNGYIWVYSDKATKLTGSLNCSKLVSDAAGSSLNNMPVKVGDSTVSVEINAAKGWNFVKVKATAGLGLSLSGATINLKGRLSTIINTPVTFSTVDALRSKVKF